MPQPHQTTTALPRPSASHTRALAAGFALACAAVAALALVGAPPAAAETIINCDTNGDGFDDLPVGTPGEDTNRIRDTGSVYLFESSDDVTDPNEDVPGDVLLPSFVIFGDGQRGDRVGESMTCADFNRDGFGDLVVGAPYADLQLRGRAFAEAGYLQVFYGSAGGLSTPPLPSRPIFQSSRGLIGASQRGDVFAADLAWCDFDSDGFNDLAIGVPGEDVRGVRDAGAVQIIYGSPRGLRNRDQLIHQGVGRADRPEPGDFFGEYVTADDFDGDGFCDLAAGVPSEDVNGVVDAGLVHVFRGGPRGITRRDHVVHRGQRGVAGSLGIGDRFGAPLAISGIAAGSRGVDLVVGVPGHDVGNRTDAGAIQLLVGTARGLTGRGGQLITQASRGIGGNPASGNQFGRSVVPGDFDNDGNADVAVGVPGQRVGRAVNAGVVKIIFGNGRRLTARDLDITGATRRFQRGEYIGARNPAERGDFFGSSLAIGDFDGNNVTDLAIGIPFEDWGRRNVDSGAVQIVRGTRAGLRGARNQILFQDIVDQVLGRPAGDERCDFFGTFNPNLAIRPPAAVTQSNCGGRSLGQPDTTSGSRTGPSMTGTAIAPPRSLAELRSLLAGSLQG